jgi:hypothetical protein
LLVYLSVTDRATSLLGRIRWRTSREAPLLLLAAKTEPNRE